MRARVTPPPGKPAPCSCPPPPRLTPTPSFSSSPPSFPPSLSLPARLLCTGPRGGARRQHPRRRSSSPQSARWPPGSHVARVAAPAAPGPRPAPRARPGLATLTRARLGRRGRLGRQGGEGADAETQGRRRRRGDQLRTWKVTRLFGEAGGRGARAAGGRRGGKGPGARGCRLGARCAWVPHPALPRLGCWRVDVCTRCVGSGVAAGRELPEAEEGYWISRSSTGEGRGALSPGRESSGSHAFSPGRPARLLLEAGGLARPSGRALPAPLLQAPGSGWEARTWARTCKLVWVSCVTLGTLRLFHIFFFAVFFLVKNQ